ncbi:MAG: histidine kinase [Spirosomataceae bacterium]
MAKNLAVKQFIWGVSFFLALFVNFPIIFLNLPRLSHSWLAQLDLFIQILLCMIYCVVFITFIYRSSKRNVSKKSQWANGFFLFTGFVILLSVLNITVIGLSSKMIPSVVMRGVLLAGISYFFSRFLTENERKNEILIENEQLKNENLQIQLTALRNQLNPHFLFNSLNTLSWLINEDKDKSQLYLQKLSQVLRYSLNMQEQSLVLLKEEMVLTDNYIYLLQMRFGDNLNVHRVIQHPEKFRIPPLSIQLLIENAVKHNIISSGNPLKISIVTDTERNCVNISNSLHIKPNSEGTGIGLVNLNERFRLLTNREIEIRQNEEFSVILPLLS